MHNRRYAAAAVFPDGQLEITHQVSVIHVSCVCTPEHLRIAALILHATCGCNGRQTSVVYILFPDTPWVRPDRRLRAPLALSHFEVHMGIAHEVRRISPRALVW